MAWLVAALRDQARRSVAPDPLVRAAVGRLRDPRTRVEALADELAVSARQLRRRFEAAVGYGPKRLARVLRLERALAAARAGDELAQAAAAAGYADQAHFAHDCARWPACRRARCFASDSRLMPIAGTGTSATRSSGARRIASVSYKTSAAVCASMGR